MRSASFFRVLQRPESVDDLKRAMQTNEFEYEAKRAIISGWHDERTGVYYINDGHHRVNAALEIAWESGDAAPLRQLLRHGKWDEGAPSANRRLPTRTVWSRLLALLNL